MIKLSATLWLLKCWNKHFLWCFVFISYESFFILWNQSFWFWETNSYDIKIYFYSIKSLYSIRTIFIIYIFIHSSKICFVIWIFNSKLFWWVYLVFNWWLPKQQTTWNEPAATSRKSPKTIQKSPETTSTNPKLPQISCNQPPNVTLFFYDWL